MPIGDRNGQPGRTPSKDVFRKLAKLKKVRFLP
jgi:hypothetical protein